MVDVTGKLPTARSATAEAWVRSNERLALYLRPDELHTAFQFEFLRAPWRADVLRPVIDATFNLKDVNAAYDRLESNETFGKVVLKVPGAGFQVLGKNRLLTNT